MQASTELGRVAAPPRENKAAFRRSWLAGFRTAIGDRLRMAGGPGRDHAASASRPRARRPRSSSQTAAPRSTSPSATSTPTSAPHGRTLSGSAQKRWAAGQRADLGGSRLAGSRQALSG